MMTVVAYVRNLFSWCDKEPPVRTNLKRERTNDDFSFDDEVPSLKRIRQLNKSIFPDNMTTKDVGAKNEKKVNTVRYIPVEIERGHPSTSTPNVVPVRTSNRVKAVPVRLIDISENVPSTSRINSASTSETPVLHAVIDDNEEVSWCEKKQESPKKNIKYICIDDDEEEIENDNDVILVRKVTQPSPIKPYKLFYAKNNKVQSRDEVDNLQYYKLTKVTDSEEKTLSRNHVRMPPKPSGGITKSYKKASVPLPKWIQGQKITSSPNRNTNENGKTKISDIFNLDEKRNYQELIKRVADTTNSVIVGKPVSIKDFIEEAVEYRNTHLSQKKSLKEIIELEKDLGSRQEENNTHEYDAITVASITSVDSDVTPSESSMSSTARINPVNSLLDSLKGNDIIAHNWLEKLNDRYKEKKQLTHKLLDEVRRESNSLSKLNYEHKLRQLEHKIKYELSIPESLIEEPQPTIELPKLTSEQERLVKRTLDPGQPAQLLVEKFGLRIHKRDLMTLSGLNWINDEVINFYMNLLMQRSQEQPNLPKVYATNTFFYPKLMKSGQAGLRRWTRKVDIFAHDLMIVPVHMGVHWCLSLVDFRTQHIAYLDSMGSGNQKCLNALLQYLKDEHHDKKGQPFDDEGWKTENLKDIPQQMNGSDCGVFACTFAEFSSRNAPYSFSQAHMPYLRKKIVLEILQGRLLL